MRVDRFATRTLCIGVVGTCAVLAAAAPPSGTRSIVLVSESLSGGAPSSEDAYWGAPTRGGRFVAFTGEGTDLVAADDNYAPDVFVRDMRTGVTVLVSADATGAPGDSGSGLPSISDDGRFVAFYSGSSDLVDGDTNFQYDAFLADRRDGTLRRVSLGPDGAEGDAASFVNGRSLSADGRYVVFQSEATDLVEGGTPASTAQVYLYDRVRDSLRLVSAAPDGTPGDGSSSDPSIARGGRFVVFVSTAANLADGGANGNSGNVFVYDVVHGTTSRVTSGVGGVPVDGYCHEPDVSDDGRIVAFNSEAPNLVAGDTNGDYDAFVVDRKAGTTTRISVGPGGVQGNGATFTVSTTADGRAVCFQSYASNLVPDDTNGAGDIFRWDAKSGKVTRISVRPDGVEANGKSAWLTPQALSGDGRFVAASSIATNLVDGVSFDGTHSQVLLVETR
jgi:Tol biopolymer transport system component